MIQDHLKQPVQQIKKPPLNQEVFENRMEHLKKELRQIQIQQFHEIRNHQRQILNQQNRGFSVSKMIYHEQKSNIIKFIFKNLHLTGYLYRSVANLPLKSSRNPKDLL